MPTTPDFHAEALARADWMRTIRETIHRRPELGLECFETSALVQQHLHDLDIPYRIVATSGLCAQLDGGCPGPVIALRADMDGLAMPDEKDVSYQSEIPGRCHACGHDAHTAMLLGIASIFAKHRGSFPGTVKFFFEPAEESGGGGSHLMIEEGVLEHPTVDAILSVHVASIPVGCVQINTGVTNASSTGFDMIIRGKGGHAAKPSDAIDPVLIASHIVIALQALVSRETRPQHCNLLGIGSIHAGSARNVIPHDATLSGTLRTGTDGDREYLLQRLPEVAHGIAAAFRAECEIEFSHSYPAPPRNNADLVERFTPIARAVAGEDRFKTFEVQGTGGESFSFFSRVCKTLVWYLGRINPAIGADQPAHTPRFDIDPACLPLGAEIQARFAWDLLENGLPWGE